jgi:hypothetical protein
MMSMGLLQNARPVPVKMLSPVLSSGQTVPSLPPQAILMRPGGPTTLHTLPVTLASIPASTLQSRIAAAIPLSQIAPLLEPSLTTTPQKDSEEIESAN